MLSSEIDKKSAAYVPFFDLVNKYDIKKYYDLQRITKHGKKLSIELMRGSLDVNYDSIVVATAKIISHYMEIGNG